MLNLIITSLIPLTLFHILYWPAQYLIVQKYLLIPRIPTIYPTLLLIFLILLTALIRVVPWASRVQPSQKNKESTVISSVVERSHPFFLFPRPPLAGTFSFLLFLLTLSLLSHHFFHTRHKDFYQRPIIYKARPSPGMQGGTITIEGARFFDSEGKLGTIKIGDSEMSQISTWTSTEIIGIIPVPSNLKNSEIHIVRPDGKESNHFKYKLIDPSKLEN